MAALDNEQFCSAMSEIARLGNANAGKWIDRNTRDDGIEVVCRIRTVNYKRFIRSNPASARLARPQAARVEQHRLQQRPAARGDRERLDHNDDDHAMGSERVILIASCN